MNLNFIEIININEYYIILNILNFLINKKSRNIYFLCILFYVNVFHITYYMEKKNEF